MPGSGVRERLRAIDLLGKYGMSAHRGLSRDELLKAMEGLVGSVMDVLGDALESDQAEKLADEIFKRWKRHLAARVDRRRSPQPSSFADPT